MTHAAGAQTIRSASVSAMADHEYTSTACHHDLHEQCRFTCKYCGTICHCLCHVMMIPVFVVNYDPPLKEVS